MLVVVLGSAQVVAEIDKRIAALRDAPQPEEPPTIFLFDRGDKTIGAAFCESRSLVGPVEGVGVDVFALLEPFRDPHPCRLRRLFGLLRPPRYPARSQTSSVPRRS